MLEQHLAFTLMNAVQGCRQHQFTAWKEKPKTNLVGQRGAFDVACTQAKT